jgi:hypothetical protein
MDLGKLDAATSNLEEGLLLSERHDLVSTRGLIMANLTELALKRHDPVAAQAYAEGACKIAKHTGSRTVESWLDLRLASISLQRGDLTAARSHLRSGLEVAVAIRRPALKSDGVALFAEILAAQGEPACARRVLYFATEHPSLTQHDRDALLASLHRLGAAPTALAWPGANYDELVGRIVHETDLAYAPLIRVLRETG